MWTNEQGLVFIVNRSKQKHLQFCTWYSISPQNKSTQARNKKELSNKVHLPCFPLQNIYEAIFLHRNKTQTI